MDGRGAWDLEYRIDLETGLEARQRPGRLAVTGSGLDGEELNESGIPKVGQSSI